MTRVRGVAALVLASVLLSSCTLVPTSKAPSRINPALVPLGLLSKTIPGTASGHVIFITQPVYIVDATGHLAPSSRIVPSPPTLSSVLRELILGPTDIEVATGYTSALPNNSIGGTRRPSWPPWSASAWSHARVGRRPYRLAGSATR